MRTITCKKCGSRTSDQYSHCIVCQTPLKLELRRSRTILSKQHASFSTIETKSIPWDREKEPRKWPKTSGIIWIAFFVSIAISTMTWAYIRYFWGMPLANRELVSWLIWLSSFYIILIGYTLITGKEARWGKQRFSVSRNIVMLVVGVIFPSIGFLMAGLVGLSIGVLVVVGTSYLFQLRKN